MIFRIAFSGNPYYNDSRFTYFLMNKILQATSRGQVTLPKGWRDKFATSYFLAEIKNDELVIKPLSSKTLKDEVEDSWQEYQEGKVISGKDLMKKYGL